MDAIVTPAQPLRGTLTVPPDKAICHRAVLLAAAAEGETDIRPWPSADDCQRTLHLVQQLGASVAVSPEAVRIRGVGEAGLREPQANLSCGESGTTLRLAAGLLAGQPFAARLTAGPSLSRRPMRRIIEPLTRMGARIEAASADAGELCPPLIVHGRRPLKALRYELPVASAQVKSAVLLAGIWADGPTTVIEPQATRDHTERMLRRLGVRVRQEGAAVTVEPGPLRAPGPLVLPGDFSSAAFLLVAAACVPGSQVTLQGVGLNPTRIRLLEVLQRMGAAVRWTAVEASWEPRGTVELEAGPLRGLALEAADVPGLIDELPILMVAAACARGTTRLQGLGELRVKETDRVRSMVEALGRLGARIRLNAAEGVEIEGGRLRGAPVDSAGDHRTAMSLAVAGLVAEGATTVRGVECVSKSFPEFFDVLRRAAGSPTVKTVDKG
ncbi:MAG: 3-phosphoshikimate 1-carboxyvinyltransferase [Candidatus Omnitrophica bacterium]|nr:3-phosphoshikimate 1-carboxyvinyltransferase [Candidatus Omnitrophota bacterium]